MDDPRETTSIIGWWYAMGPSGIPFEANNKLFNVHTVVKDPAEEADLPRPFTNERPAPKLPCGAFVVIENGGGQRFALAREMVTAIASPPGKKWDHKSNSYAPI